MKKSISLKQIVCDIYLAVLFVVYPLFQHNGYYDMGMNKYYFYLISTIAFLVLLVITIVTDPDTFKSSNKSKRKNSKKKTNTPEASLTFKEKLINLKDKFLAWFKPLSIVEKFVWAYLACIIISFIFGINKYVGFWGSDGWQMGLLVQCLMIACFFVFAKVWEPDMLPFYFSMAGSSLVFLLGILMRFGIDPLGNYEGLDTYYVQMFISTIGQSSWYSGYMCAVFPLGVGLYFISEDKKTRIISGLYSVLTFCALAIHDSDSEILGIGCFCLVLLWLAFNNMKSLTRTLEIYTMIAFAFAFMGVVRRGLINSFNGPDSITLKISDNGLIIPTFIALLIITVLCHCLGKNSFNQISFKNDKILKIIRKVIFIIIAFVPVLIAVFIYLNTKWKLGFIFEEGHKYNNYMYFDQYWGNMRGSSWKACALIFMDYPLWRKLIGIGPDSLFVISQYNERYRSILDLVFESDNVLTCAHNEFFNSIVTYGIIGGIAYIGIFASGIYRYVKEYIKKPIVILGAMCIASYCGHNFFCYQTVLCTPFILVIMGICEANISKN